jgi:hypothetical protein
MSDNGKAKELNEALNLTTPEGEVAHQVLITLFKDGRTNCAYSCDTLMARGLLDMARFSLDLQALDQIQADRKPLIETPDYGFHKLGKRLA